MTYAIILLAAALAAVAQAIHQQRRQDMVTAASLTASFTNLSTAVTALAAAYQAKNTGVDPATLQPIQDGMDQLATNINNLLTPPTPAPAP